MPPYHGSHERCNESDWMYFVSNNLTSCSFFLTPNVPKEHGYDEDIMDEALNNIQGMWARCNPDTGVSEISIVGMYYDYYVWMICRPIDEDTVRVFHLMPLSRDDASELDFQPESWYDYPNKIIKKNNDDDDEEWWG